METAHCGAWTSSSRPLYADEIEEVVPDEELRQIAAQAVRGRIIRLRFHEHSLERLGHLELLLRARELRCDEGTHIRLAALRKPGKVLAGDEELKFDIYVGERFNPQHFVKSFAGGVLKTCCFNERLVSEAASASKDGAGLGEDPQAAPPAILDVTKLQNIVDCGMPKTLLTRLLRVNTSQVYQWTRRGSRTIKTRRSDVIMPTENILEICQTLVAAGYEPYRVEVWWQSRNLHLDSERPAEKFHAEGGAAAVKAAAEADAEVAQATAETP